MSNQQLTLLGQKSLPGLLLVFIFVALSGLTNKLNDDFDIIKSRVVAELMKPGVDSGEIRNILKLLQTDGSFSDINYEDLSRTAGFPHRRHTHRLVDLARAFCDKNSNFHGSRDLLNTIARSLKFWVDHDFFGDNWHNNQISTPTNLVNLMLLVGDTLPTELVEKAQPMIGRAHMNASGARPSGDRIVIAGILAKNLLFMGDRKRFDEIIRIIEGEIKFSTGKRGMQHDYSFHHRVDRVNNTVSYGYGKYANAFGEWSYYVAGTSYAFSQKRINHLIDYYLDGIYKQLVYGIYPDISVKNRSISHPQTFEPKGTLEIERLLLSSDHRQEELEQIIKLRKGEVEPSESFCKFFWQTEHFVFQRPNYYTTVRMFSTRNQNMEVPYNGPGKTTHHRADGTNYLVRRGDEYLNIWPVYDWQKISGSTIMQKPALPGPGEIRKHGTTEFVGAVEDGMHGAVSFDFRSPHDGLTARKAWFFFESAYLCLGAAIRSNPNLPVFTTLNQTLLIGPVHASAHGALREMQSGFHTLKNVDWIHHDGIGYVPIDPPQVEMSNQTEKGRWSDITDQKNISRDIVEKDVFSLWIDHGRSPDSATYAYLVIPDVSISDLSQVTIENLPIQILSNTKYLQAAKEPQTGTYQIAFYRAGRLQLTDQLRISSASQGMVMIKDAGNQTIDLTISDPSRKLNRMMIAMSQRFSTTDQDCKVIDLDGKETMLIIDLPQGFYRGKSKTIRLQSL